MSPSRFFSSLPLLCLGLALGGCLQANGETCQIDGDCESSVCCKTGPAEARGICAVARDERCPISGTIDSGSGEVDAGADVDAAAEDAAMPEDASMPGDSGSDAATTDAATTDAGDGGP